MHSHARPFHAGSFCPVRDSCALGISTFVGGRASLLAEEEALISGLILPPVKLTWGG